MSLFIFHVFEYFLGSLPSAPKDLSMCCSRSILAYAYEQLLLMGHGHAMDDVQPARRMASSGMRCMEDLFLWFQLKACGWTASEADW